MYRVIVTKIIKNKQESDLIIKTKDKYKAELALEGTVMGLKYSLKEQDLKVITKQNKVQMYYNDISITVAIKEDK